MTVGASERRTKTGLAEVRGGEGLGVSLTTAQRVGVGQNIGAECPSVGGELLERAGGFALAASAPTTFEEDE